MTKLIMQEPGMIWSMKGYAPDYNNEQMIQYHKGQLMHLESILAEMDWSVISNLEVWGTGENGM